MNTTTTYTSRPSTYAELVAAIQLVNPADRSLQAELDRLSTDYSVVPVLYSVRTRR